MTGKPRGRFYDITGARFGRLTVAGKGESRSKQTSWDCLCDCGTSVNVLKHSLVSGATQSCGCFMRERAAERISARSTTHGCRHSPEYSVWSGIKRRCQNRNDASFSQYGGRGIEVRFASFEAFLAEVGQRPSDAHSIDRIDPDGHYEPGNVRWATRSIQARNKRGSLLVNVGGKEAPLKDFCDRLGVSYRLAWERMRRGWSAPRALGVSE